jgi:putative membrane protein
MRPALFWLGLGTLAVAWLGPLGALVPGPFSAHMTMHMLVVAVAAPLLALGVAGGRFDPVRQAPAFFAAVPASIVELVLVWGWHTPVLHHAARHFAPAFLLEQASFLLSGLWLWLSAFGDTNERHERRGAGILGLLLTSMHMTLLGALLALPPRALYPHHGGHAAELTPLADQHLGGAIMIVLGGAAYLFGGLWLGVGLLRERTAREAVGERPSAKLSSESPHPGAGR